MAWQTYVDERLMCKIDEGPGKNLTSAAILAFDGTLRAKSPAFPELTSEEFDDIMNEFAQPGHLATGTVAIGGIKYMLIDGEPGLMIRAAKGAKGVCIMKTGQNLVFGFYDDTIPTAMFRCSTFVQGFGEYLVAQGF